MTEVNGVKTYKYFAGGEWRSVGGDRLFDVYRPYDRALFAPRPRRRPRRSQDCSGLAAAAGVSRVVADDSPAERARLFFNAVEIVEAAPQGDRRYPRARDR